jgi:hypothetical protein
VIETSIAIFEAYNSSMAMSLAALAFSNWSLRFKISASSSEGSWRVWFEWFVRSDVAGKEQIGSRSKSSSSSVHGVSGVDMMHHSTISKSGSESS